MIILIISIVVIIFALLLYKGLDVIENWIDGYTPEGFKNLNSNSQSECNDLENLHNIYLTAPIAVNTPFDEFEKTFFTGIIDEPEKDDFKVTGKYCFPKEKLMYDGIWSSNKVSNNSFESVIWSMPDNKPIEGIYCGNKFLDLPEKPLAPDDIIFKPDACDKYFPAATNTSILCDQLSNGEVCSSNPNDIMVDRSRAFEI